MKINKRSGLPQYCVRKTTQRGKAHYYYQRQLYRVPLPHPGADNFWSEYQKAHDQSPDFRPMVEESLINLYGVSKHKIMLSMRVIERGARERAKKSGREYSLPPDWLYETLVSQGGRCAISGMTLRPATRRFDPLSPSIDRIDSLSGYSVKNCHVVSLGVNISKRDMTVEEFASMCQAVAANVRRTQREQSAKL